MLKAEGMTLTSRQRTKALERIGRLYMRKDENDLAISYFTKLATQFPKSRRVPTQFLAAWLRTPGRIFGCFADDAFVCAEVANGSDALKHYSLRRGLVTYRRTTALHDVLYLKFLKIIRIAKGLWSYYGGGRSRKSKGRRARKKEILLKIAPLGYWGHWSSAALADWESKSFFPPPMTKIASIDQARKMQKSVLSLSIVESHCSK